MHFKEHAGAGGRLHLNILWDWEWIDQGELSQMAAACGFGPVCHISRVGRGVEVVAGRAGSSAAVRYSTKSGFRVVAYARKTGSQTAAGDDWPKRVRRWSASRSASADMGPKQRNSEWHWTAVEPPSPIERESAFNYWLLPDDYLPSRQPVPRPPPNVLLKPAEQFSLALS